MVIYTNTEYYGKFSYFINPDEDMQCFDDNVLVKRFCAFLEQSEDNMFTRKIFLSLILEPIQRLILT